MKVEEEERLRSKNLGVESIFQDDNDDYLARREQIKVDMRSKINYLFKCNLEDNKRKDNLIDLAKYSYNTMQKFMKKHIILSYTIDKNNVSSDYIDLIHDEVIEESLLKNKLSLFFI